MSDYKYVNKIQIKSKLAFLLGCIIVVCAFGVITINLGKDQPDIMQMVLFGFQFVWGVVLIGMNVETKKKRVPITEMDKLKEKLS